jgi:hypothetical protein
MGYKNIYIYLDDERTPNWNKIPDYASVIECKTYEGAVAAIETACNLGWTELTIDLDHDLGSKKTGYDFCKYLVENGWKGKFHCHTANPVGAMNMRQLLTHYGWEEC